MCPVIEAPGHTTPTATTTVNKAITSTPTRFTENPTRLSLEAIEFMDMRDCTEDNFLTCLFAGRSQATIMVSGLPAKTMYTEFQLKPLFGSFGPASVYVLPDNGVAFYGIKNGKHLYKDNLWEALLNGIPFLDDTILLRAHVLVERVIVSPLGFYRALMKWSGKLFDEATLPQRVVFMNKFPHNVIHWTSLLCKLLAKTGCVRTYLPLMTKTFVEFETTEAADHFGLLMAQQTNTVKKHLRRLVQGDEMPFWVLLKTAPPLYPTFTPTFYTPEHRTVNGPEDVKWAECCAHDSRPNVVMATGLPSRGYKHEDLVQKVWPYFTQKNIYRFYYHVVILPLERRAFIYFDDCHKCIEFVSAHLQKPLSLGESDVTIHFLLEPLSPSYTELDFYKNLLQWSNLPVGNLRPEQLVQAELHDCSVEVIPTILTTLLTPTINLTNCVVLANRVIFHTNHFRRVECPVLTRFCQSLELMLSRIDTQIGPVNPIPFRTVDEFELHLRTTCISTLKFLQQPSRPDQKPSGTTPDGPGSSKPQQPTNLAPVSSEKPWGRHHLGHHHHHSKSKKRIMEAHGMPFLANKPQYLQSQADSFAEDDFDLSQCFTDEVGQVADTSSILPPASPLPDISKQQEEPSGPQDSKESYKESSKSSSLSSSSYRGVGLSQGSPKPSPADDSSSSSEAMASSSADIPESSSSFSLTPALVAPSPSDQETQQKKKTTSSSDQSLASVSTKEKSTISTVEGPSSSPADDFTKTTASPSQEVTHINTREKVESTGRPIRKDHSEPLLETSTSSEGELARPDHKGSAETSAEESAESLTQRQTSHSDLPPEAEWGGLRIQAQQEPSLSGKASLLNPPESALIEDTLRPELEKSKVNDKEDGDESHQQEGVKDQVIHSAPRPVGDEETNQTVINPKEPGLGDPGRQKTEPETGQMLHRLKPFKIIPVYMPPTEEQDASAKLSDKESTAGRDERTLRYTKTLRYKSLDDHTWLFQKTKSQSRRSRRRKLRIYKRESFPTYQVMDCVENSSSSPEVLAGEQKTVPTDEQASGMGHKRAMRGRPSPGALHNKSNKETPSPRRRVSARLCHTPTKKRESTTAAGPVEVEVEPTEEPSTPKGREPRSRADEALLASPVLPQGRGLPEEEEGEYRIVKKKESTLNLEDDKFDVLDAVEDEVGEEPPTTQRKGRTGRRSQNAPRGTAAQQEQETEEATHHVVDSAKGELAVDGQTAARGSGRRRSERSTRYMSPGACKQTMEEQRSLYCAIDSIEENPSDKDSATPGASEQRKSSRSKDQTLAKTARVPDNAPEGEEPLYHGVDFVGCEPVPEHCAQPKVPIRGRKGMRAISNVDSQEEKPTKKRKAPQTSLPEDERKDEAPGVEEEVSIAIAAASNLLSLDEVSEEEEEYPEDWAKEEEPRKRQVAIKERKMEEEREERTREEEVGLVTLDEPGEEEQEDDRGGEEKNRGITEGELQALVTLDQIVGDGQVGEEPSQAEPPTPLQDSCSGDGLNPVSLVTLDQTVCCEKATEESIASKHKRNKDHTESVSFVMRDEVGEEEEQVETPRRRSKRVRQTPVRRSTRGGVTPPKEPNHESPSRQQAPPTLPHASSPLGDSGSESQSRSAKASRGQPGWSASPAGRGQLAGEVEAGEKREGATRRSVRSESRKRRGEVEGAEPKRTCSRSPSVANDSTLPPFTPHNPLGLDHVVPKAGFFCNLCSEFYEDESKARIVHCSSLTHYDNLKKHYQKVQEEQSRSEPGSAAPGHAPL